MLEVKKIEEFSGEEQYDLARNHLIRAMRKANAIKTKYEHYLCNASTQTNREEGYKFLVTHLLEKLGYPMEAFGTYLYVEEISEVVKRLNEDENAAELLSQDFKNSYSMFYISIIKDELDMKPKDFHKHIKEAIENIDYNKTDISLTSSIYKGVSDIVTHEENALLLGSYIVSRSKQQSADIPKVKQIKSEYV